MAYKKSNPNGQATMANSEPLVIASDQTAIPVTGNFFQANQPVSLATAPTTPVTGTFFQAAQPITDNAGSLTVDAPVGTPAFVRLSDGVAAIITLPVSAATLPLPSGAATEATLTLVSGTDVTTPSPAMPAGGVGIRGWLSAIWTKLNASLAVTGTFWQATQPVSGTFFQATQPISLATAPVTPVTDNAGSLTVDAPVGTPAFVRLSDGAAAIATLPVSLAIAPTTPVTGTFWQATQPISLATLPVTNAGTFAVQATLAAETTKVIGTVNVSSKQTYRASTIIPLVAAVTVNVPFFNIIGSATKIVTINRIVVSGMTLTAVGYYTINVEKLSTASSGGTSTTLVATTLDSLNAAPTAVVKAYTAAPTKGTLAGTLRSYRSLWQATVAAATGTTSFNDFSFGEGDATGVVLRGVAQELALVFPVVLASAGTLSVNIEWTEE